MARKPTPQNNPRNTPRNSRQRDRAASSTPPTHKPAATPSRERLAFIVDRPRLTPPPGFIAAAESFGIAFEPGEIERYGHYLALLLANNHILNLTAITDPDEAWRKHILDSLTLLPVFEMEESTDESAQEIAEQTQPNDPSAATDPAPSESPNPPAVQRVCDLGSGGGAPGIVLAIARPDIAFTLVEATAKKAEFLEMVISELALTNVMVLNARAEEVGAYIAGQGPTSKPGTPRPLGMLHRGFYDLVTARAVGRIAVVAEWAVPLARIAGRIALIKGEKASEELAEAKQALHLLHTHHLTTLDTPTGRIVVLEKRRKTPALYPRKVGEAKRRPLGVQD